MALAEAADLLIVGYETVTARVIQSAGRLRLIACGRGNPVNVDREAASARRIPILYAPGRNAEAAAEFTLGLILDCARNISRGDRALRAGKYTGPEREEFSSADPGQDIIWDIDGSSPYRVFEGQELRGRILGLIGLGYVASQVARLAQAFGMRVLAYNFGQDHERAGATGVTLAGLDELLSQSDFISVHCKLSPESRGLIDRRAFTLMKPGAYLINTARAAIVDQGALLDALQAGRIAGAALDVFWYEPLPANHPLLALDNVILTPHLAGAAADVPERHSRMIVDDVLAWLDGKQPKHIFNLSDLKA